MFCSRCGAENPEGAKFCFKCGAELEAAAKSSEAEAKPEAESSTGMSANVAGLLCYLAGWITGIVFVVLEKKSKFVKFHAWQSIMVFGVLTVAHLILSRMLIGIGWSNLFYPNWGLIHAGVAFGWIIGMLMLALWIVLMIFAYQGKTWKAPLAGNWAEKQANK
ncbi:MAG: zinc-ribbon domain-containing protein [Dehalococcoidia bacterium]